jgi:hypothetical protein
MTINSIRLITTSTHTTAKPCALLRIVIRPGSRRRQLAAEPRN